MPDFNVKDNFPMAAVIQAAQQSANRQQEIQQQGQQQLVAGLQSIGQVGQSLFDQRKRVAQSLALGRQFDVPDNVSRMMEPEEVLKVGAIKKGQIDMSMLLNLIHPGSAGTTQQVPGATPASATPQPQSGGATLTSNATTTPIDPGPGPGFHPDGQGGFSNQPVQPSSGLTPTTTAPMQVPIAAPPSRPAMVNPATFNAAVKLSDRNRMEPVMTQEDALKSGSVPKGTHLVRSANNTDQVSWETATPQQQSLARAMYEGRVRPSDIGFRDRGKVTLLANEYAGVNGLPPFRSYNADVNATMAKFSTSGKLGQNALSLNTALGHAASAYDSYEAIGNTDQKWLNVPINTLKKQTNDPNVVALGINLNALQGELANVFKNSGATDQEIGHWKTYLNEDLTPAQFTGALSKIDELLKSRLSAMEYQRETAGGGGGNPLISPHAKEISGKLSRGQPTSSAGQAAPAWAPEKEQRYQELLRKRESKGSVSL